jgi:Na+-driven multidrug efflux pump
VLLVPAAVAFGYDGVLIGAGDYRFLGLAAVGYLIAVVPLGLLALRTGAGIAGIWAALVVWMALRAIVNHRRAQRLLTVTPRQPSAGPRRLGRGLRSAPR